jgi:hypothetical protein
MWLFAGFGGLCQVTDVTHNQENNRSTSSIGPEFPVVFPTWS